MQAIRKMSDPISEIDIRVQSLAVFHRTMGVPHHHSGKALGKLPLRKGDIVFVIFRTAMIVSPTGFARPASQPHGEIGMYP